MSRFRNREAPLEKERFLKLLSRVGVLCHLNFSFSSSYHSISTLSVLQYTTHTWPSFKTFQVCHPLPFELCSTLFWGVCLSCRDTGSISESIMIVIVPRGSSWELPRTRVSLGWLTACQLPSPNQTAWGHGDISPRQQICTDINWTSWMLTPPVGLLIVHWCRR